MSGPFQFPYIIKEEGEGGTEGGGVKVKRYLVVRNESLPNVNLHAGILDFLSFQNLEQ